jgi:hypothetical protein
VIDKDETQLKVTDLQRLVECVIILFSPINFVSLESMKGHVGAIRSAYGQMRRPGSKLERG